MYSYSDSSEESSLACGVLVQDRTCSKHGAREKTSRRRLTVVARVVQKPSILALRTSIEFATRACRARRTCRVCFADAIVGDRSSSVRFARRNHSSPGTCSVPPFVAIDGRSAHLARATIHAACFAWTLLRSDDASVRRPRVVVDVSLSCAEGVPTWTSPSRQILDRSETDGIFSDATKRRTTASVGLAGRRSTKPSKKHASGSFGVDQHRGFSEGPMGRKGGEPRHRRGFLGGSEKSCGRTPLDRHTDERGWGERQPGTRTGNCQGGNVLHVDWSKRSRAFLRRLTIGPSVRSHPSLRSSSRPRNPRDPSPPFLCAFCSLPALGPRRPRRAFLPSHRALQRKALLGPSQVDVLVHRHRTRRATRRSGARAALRHLRFSTCSERRNGRVDAGTSEEDACRSERPCVRERDANGRRSRR